MSLYFDKRFCDPRDFYDNYFPEGATEAEVRLATPELFETMITNPTLKKLFKANGDKVTTSVIEKSNLQRIPIKSLDTIGFDKNVKKVRRKFFKEYNRAEIFGYLFNNGLIDSRKGVATKPQLKSRMIELGLLDYYCPKYGRNSNQVVSEVNSPVPYSNARSKKNSLETRVKDDNDDLILLTLSRVSTTRLLPVEDYKKDPSLLPSDSEDLIYIYKRYFNGVNRSILAREGGKLGLQLMIRMDTAGVLNVVPKEN